MHRSRTPASSVEFAEHKEYAPGDEIRHIDWKAYGKFDRYYVKRFEDETELRTYLLVDSSASMGYGRRRACRKLEYARYLAAALAYLLAQQGDPAGLVAVRREDCASTCRRARAAGTSAICWWRSRRPTRRGAPSPGARWPTWARWPTGAA